MVLDHGSELRMETIAISKFKATCLSVLERVRRTGKPVLVTRFGKPVAEIVPPSPAKRPAHWLGAMRGTGRITGDIVALASDADEWAPGPCRPIPRRHGTRPGSDTRHRRRTPHAIQAVRGAGQPLTAMQVIGLALLTAAAS